MPVVDPEDPLPASIETKINWVKDLNKFESKLNPNHFKISKDGSALSVVKDFQASHSLSERSLRDSQNIEMSKENK